MTSDRTYPYRPSRERDLAPGEFWSIPLSDGRYGCGVVMELGRVGRTVNVFHGVLLDWTGTSPPTAEHVLSTIQIVSFSTCGVKAITVSGGQVEGRVDTIDLKFGLPEVLLPAEGGMGVFRGSKLVRTATAEDRSNLERHGAGSIGSFIARAESTLVTTERIIVLCLPTSERVNKGKLRVLLAPLGEVDRTVRSVASADGKKVYLAIDPPRRQFIGEDWYHGAAETYLDRGYVPVVFDFAPNSTLGKQAITTVVNEWAGYVDNGIAPIMTAAEFTERFPVGQRWSFRDADQ